MRSLLGQWWLLTVLAFGVIAMHHTPLAHADEARHAPPPAASSVEQGQSSHGVDRQLPAGAGENSAGENSASTASAADDHPAEGHGFLHLCLAILAGAAAVFALLVQKGPLPSLRSWVRSAIRPGIWRFRPPLPVPRRLALLCVLRL